MHCFFVRNWKHGLNFVHAYLPLQDSKLPTRQKTWRIPSFRLVSSTKNSVGKKKQENNTLIDQSISRSLQEHSGLCHWSLFDWSDLHPTNAWKEHFYIAFCFQELMSYCILNFTLTLSFKYSILFLLKSSRRLHRLNLSKYVFVSSKRTRDKLVFGFVSNWLVEWPCYSSVGQTGRRCVCFRI